MFGTPLDLAAQNRASFSAGAVLNSQLIALFK
jgi:hypothetical protein